MLKIERITYKGIGYQRLIYVTENETVSSVVSHIYPLQDSKGEVEFQRLELGVWGLDFVFRYIGKYVFVIFEDGLKTFILIVTIE